MMSADVGATSYPDGAPPSIVIPVRANDNVVEVFRDELPDDPNGQTQRRRRAHRARARGG